MLGLKSIFATAFVLGAAAQTEVASPQYISSISQQFAAAGITTDLNLTTGTTGVAAFNPEGALQVIFAGVAPLTAGQLLPTAQVGAQPAVSFTPGASAPDFDPTKLFIIAMVDAMVDGVPDSASGKVRHWLTANVTAQAGPNGTYTLTPGANDISTYKGPAPPAGSGPHRYTLMLIPQTDSFNQAAGGIDTTTPIQNFDFSGWLQQTGLTAPIIGGNYFLAEEGTATVTPSMTSSVAAPTATYVAASGSASNATSASGNGSASGTASSTGSAASSPSSSSTSKSGAAEKSFASVTLAIVAACMAIVI